MPQVIARRYRPQSFEEVIGQEPIVRTLRQAVASGRLAHGFIFSGHRGIGKTTLARILAKALNCQAAGAPTPTPCGECDACREIRDGSAVDVIEIDAASHRGIDEIRALRERVRYQPARDRYKVFILDEAHQLTADAFNALLKTLEEPPAWVVFILATTEPEALPATIRSRCQHYAFRAVPFAAILGHLEAISRQEGVAAEREALELIAEAGEGSVRDALSLLDQAMTYGGDGVTQEAVRALLGRVASARIRELLEAIRDGAAGLLLQRTARLLADGVGPAPLCWQLTQAVRNALVAQSGPELLEASESERAAAVEAAAWFNQEELARFLHILLHTAGELRFGQQERLHLELGLVQMLHARRLTSVEEVLASLRGEAPPAGARSAPAVAQPAPAAAPVSAAAPAAAAADDDVSAAVLRTLERAGKASLMSVVSVAQWVWSEGRLELVYPSAQAGLAKLADQASTRQALAAACRSALNRVPEVTVRIAGDAVTPPAGPAAAPGPAGDSPERLAEQHPLLRQLRAQVPTNVLKTRPFTPQAAEST